jgi:HlyD family secretion protein
MTIEDLSDMWFTFNIREDRLHNMQSGDRIELSIPALDGMRISATVYYISARESYATWKATRETGEFDTRTFEVRARPDYQIPGLRPGMSAIMTVESGK